MNSCFYFFVFCAVSSLHAADTPNMTAQVRAAKEATLAVSRMLQEIPLSILATGQNNPSNSATNVPATIHTWEQLHHQLAYHTHLYHHGMTPAT